MIICVCNAITEDELCEAAASGAPTPELAFQKLGHEPQCGSCLCYAQEFIDEHRRKLPRTKLRIVA